MNPEVSLCEHLGADDLPRLGVRSKDVFEWAEGPLSASLRCAVCCEGALLERMAVDVSRDVSLYRVSGLRDADLRLFQRNVERGSCDLARRALEVEALFAAAGPPTRVVACTGDEGSILASAPWPEAMPLSEADTLPASYWLELLGLSQGSGSA